MYECLYLSSRTTASCDIDAGGRAGCVPVYFFFILKIYLGVWPARRRRVGAESGRTRASQWIVVTRHHAQSSESQIGGQLVI